MITQEGRQRINNGNTLTTNGAEDFAVWMVAWVAAQAGTFTIEDLKTHARNTNTYPDQTQDTLKAAAHLNEFPKETLVKAIKKGWVVKQQ